MTLEAERYLWDRMRVAGDDEAPTPREVIDEMVRKGMIQSEKQAWATLQKWDAEGCYEWGVTMDLGWRYAQGPFPARLRAADPCTKSCTDSGGGPE